MVDMVNRQRGRRQGQEPGTTPPHKTPAGMSVFEHGLWRDVMLAAITSGRGAHNAAEMAEVAITRWRRSKSEFQQIAKDPDDAEAQFAILHEELQDWGKNMLKQLEGSDKAEKIEGMIDNIKDRIDDMHYVVTGG